MTGKSVTAILKADSTEDLTVQLSDHLNEYTPFVLSGVSYSSTAIDDKRVEYSVLIIIIPQ